MRAVARQNSGMEFVAAIATEDDLNIFKLIHCDADDRLCWPTGRYVSTNYGCVVAWKGPRGYKTSPDVLIQ